MATPTIGTNSKTLLDFAQTTLENNLSDVLDSINAEHSTSLTMPLRYRRSELVHRDFVSPEISLWIVSEDWGKFDGFNAYDVTARWACRVLISAIGQSSATETQLYDAIAAYGSAVVQALHVNLRSESSDVIWMTDPKTSVQTGFELRDQRRSQWIQSVTTELESRYRARMIA